MRRIASIAIILIMIVGFALAPTIIAGKLIGGVVPPSGGIPGGGITPGGGTTPEEGINTSDKSTEFDSEEGTPSAPVVDDPEEPPEEPPEEDPYVPPSGGSSPNDPEDGSSEEDPQEDMEGMAPSIDEDIVVLNIQSKTDVTSSHKVESITLSVDEVVSGVILKIFLPK